jgi:GH15 family glucan-1,4-alpha-glucosidase
MQIEPEVATPVAPAGASAPSETQRYRPIEQYGVIGDCRTAALVGPDGSIDWCCMPHFDSEAIFLRLLDADRGGYFRVQPLGATASAMAYVPNTNVLATTFTTPTGTLRLVDSMPVRPRGTRRLLGAEIAALLSNLPHSHNLEREAGNDVAAAHRINRFATCLFGEVDLEVALKVTFDYARQAARVALQPVGSEAAAAILSAGGRYLVFLLRHLPSPVPLPRSPELHLTVEADVLRARIHLQSGERVIAALNNARDEAEAQALLGSLVGQDFDADLDETLLFWRGWAARCRYHGPYQEAVLRSALALKLCTFEPTGAIVAAPTTSLPEAIGGVRNWDYRYTWLRDSAFTVGALESLGYRDEARDYLHFLHDLQLRSGSDLRVLYSILGHSGAQLAEQTLDHLEGYRGSRPVRIGNGATGQRQLDVYGELLDAAYSYVVQDGYREAHRAHESNRDLRALSAMVADFVEHHWQDLDRGIWEVRGPERAFVYSRAMCWGAMHRACTLAAHHGHEHHLARWSAVAQRIRADVIEHGYNSELGTFTQAYGDRTLDAANLRLPLVGFLPVADPRMQSTIEVTQAALQGPGGFLYRYHPVGADGRQLPGTQPADDGLLGSEGAFLACTFWLVSDLCHLGRLEEARRLFERMLACASSLGLFSEEFDPASGEMLGNFPQAYTHIGLINAAVAIELAVQGRLTTQALTSHPEE